MRLTLYCWTLWTCWAFFVYMTTSSTGHDLYLCLLITRQGWSRPLLRYKRGCGSLSIQATYCMFCEATESHVHHRNMQWQGYCNFDEVGLHKFCSLAQFLCLLDQYNLYTWRTEKCPVSRLHPYLLLIDFIRLSDWTESKPSRLPPQVGHKSLFLVTVKSSPWLVHKWEWDGKTDVNVFIWDWIMWMCSTHSSKIFSTKYQDL